MIRIFYAISKNKFDGRNALTGPLPVSGYYKWSHVLFRTMNDYLSYKHAIFFLIAM